MDVVLYSFLLENVTAWLIITYFATMGLNGGMEIQYTPHMEDNI